MFNYSFNPPIKSKLRLFSEYGFEYIHWCDDWNVDALYTEQDVKRYSRLVESVGLRCLDVHGAATANVLINSVEETWRKRYIELLENRIRFCASIGGDAVVIHPPAGKTGSLELIENLNRSLYVFKRIRPLCKDLGVTIAIENCSANAKEILEFFFEKYPPDFLGFCFDSGHAHIPKIFDQLTGFGNRLKALHLHDNRGERDEHQPPFWGTIDWERVAKWIKESGYSKPINFEVIHYPVLFNGTMEEFLKYTVDAIKRVMKLF